MSDTSINKSVIHCDIGAPDYLANKLECDAFMAHNDLLIENGEVFLGGLLLFLLWINCMKRRRRNG